MGNLFKTAVVGAIAAAFVASVAIAGGQQGSGDQQRPAIGQGRQAGPGGMRGPGGRGRGGALGGMFADLTDQQREQVKAILDAERQGEQGPPADMKLRQALEQELLADSPNVQKIDELKQQIVAATSESLTRHIAIQQKINQVLTAEQRAKARERIGQRGEGRRGGNGLHPRH
jgi:Spy/CpxP family protein refolding chaperone